MQHDTCRKIDGNDFVGQNLAMAGSTVRYYDPQTIARKAIEIWFNEIELCNQTDIDEFQGIGWVLTLNSIFVHTSTSRLHKKKSGAVTDKAKVTLHKWQNKKSPKLVAVPKTIMMAISIGVWPHAITIMKIWENNQSMNRHHNQAANVKLDAIAISQLSVQRTKCMYETSLNSNLNAR